MQFHLVYVGSPRQIALTRESLIRLAATPHPDPSFNPGFLLRHPSLGDMSLVVHLLSQIEAVSPHLRQCPVDLLIYDEREGGLDALTAVQQISDDVDALASLWGSDFHFPMKRVVAILAPSPDQTTRTFRLGRHQVRDVLVAPRHLYRILRWIARLLVSDAQQMNRKAGLAMSGGGVEGCLFQIGCAHALDQALTGRGLRDCDVYSGVSSGSIVVSAIAGGIPLEEVISAFAGRPSRLPRMTTSQLYDVAAADLVRRTVTPGEGWWSGLDPARWIQRLIRAIPTGFFKGDALRRFVREGLKEFGGDDTFDGLDRELIIGATDQDTFKHVVLGRAPWRDMPISEAVRASCALPPIFTPLSHGDHRFIDGQITRTCNLEQVVRSGCHLVFIIDPLIPYTSMEAGAVEREGGVYTVIQTIKTLVHTRFRSALAHLTERYPHVDFMIFQPYEECARAMSGSPMKLRMNTEIIQMAYRGTMRRLRERHHIYHAKLAKYGFQLATPDHIRRLERRGVGL